MSHNHSHAHADTTLGSMKVAFWLNLLFTAIEIVGGILTNSVAIISDAIHDLGDSVAIGVSLFLEKYSRRRPTEKFTYGYRRFSTLGALINSVVLLVGSAVILVKVVPRLLHPEAVDSDGMMWLAIAGIVFNGMAVLKLRKGNSISGHAVMLHLMEDVLGWVAVLLGSVVIKLTGWLFIDPLLSLGICFYILYNVCRNMGAIFRVFLQSAPEEVDAPLLKAELMDIDGVTGVHDVHIWSLDGYRNVGSLHIVVDCGVNAQRMIEIKQTAREIAEKAGIMHATIEIEYPEEHADAEGEHCSL